MDHGTIPEAIARLQTDAMALEQAYRDVAPFVAQASYNPLFTWLDVPFLLLPQGDTRLKILKTVWYSKPMEWSAHPAQSAHQGMAVEQAKHRWKTSHTKLVLAIRDAVEAMLHAAYTPETLEDTVRHIDANVSVRVDGKGTSVSLNVLRTPTTPQRAVKEETRRLSLAQDAAWLPLLLRGALHMSRQEPPGPHLPRWRISATLAQATKSDNVLNVQQNVQAATPHEALMAVALTSHNSLVVPYRIPELEIHQALDVDDHHGFLAGLATAFP